MAVADEAMDAGDLNNALRSRRIATKLSSGGVDLRSSFGERLPKVIGIVHLGGTSSFTSLHVSSLDGHDTAVRCLVRKWTLLMKTPCWMRSRDPVG